MVDFISRLSLDTLNLNYFQHGNRGPAASVASVPYRGHPDVWRARTEGQQARPAVQVQVLEPRRRRHVQHRGGRAYRHEGVLRHVREPVHGRNCALSRPNRRQDQRQRDDRVPHRRGLRSPGAVRRAVRNLRQGARGEGLHGLQRDAKSADRDVARHKRPHRQPHRSRASGAAQPPAAARLETAHFGRGFGPNSDPLCCEP